MAADIPPDRAVIHDVTDDGTAVLLVGPGKVELHVPADSLPDGAGTSTWVILDVQSRPPIVIGVDHERTDAG